MNASPSIVLIDDDRAWLETLTDFLEGKGFQVRTAQEGRHGLALLEAREAGLAIIDFHLPGLDGLELLRRVRGRHDLSILMLSSDDDPALPARALAEGARAFLPKTLAPGRLLRALLEVVTAALPAPWERLLPVPVRLYLPMPRSRFDPRRN